MQNPTITVKPINIYSDIAVALFHQCAFTIIFQEFVGPQTPSLFEEHTLNVYFPQGKLENVTLLFSQFASIHCHGILLDNIYIYYSQVTGGLN